jgi:hypothetical protein
MRDLETYADIIILLESQVSAFKERNNILEDKLLRINDLQEKLILMNLNLYKENEKLKKK